MGFKTIEEAMNSEEGYRLYRRLRVKFSALLIMSPEVDAYIANIVFKLLNKEKQNEKTSID